MAQPFRHEKLIVYQKGMRFATWRSALLHELLRRVAAMLTALSKAATHE